MARTPDRLPEGPRLTDYISLGVIAKTFPHKTVAEVLEQTGKTSQRRRALPADVMVYVVIGLALYMDVCYREVVRCLLEGVQWLAGPDMLADIPSKSAISRARTRLGSEPLEQLHDRIVAPVACKDTVGARYRGWHLMSLDGSTMAVGDTERNEKAFGRPAASRGKTAYPRFRFVSLVENGTHVLIGTRMGHYDSHEQTLARRVITHLRKGMLCLADRNFYGLDLWQQAQAQGADLLWRMKSSASLPCIQRLHDGSYISKVYPSWRDRRHDENGQRVRVIEYELQGVQGSEPMYRVMTTILDPDKAPAQELAALYHERWEIENALDELKTHLRGPHIVLRSKKPELVRQEFYGFMLAHFAIRALMHEAAMQHNKDPDELSFVHAVRVIKRRLTTFNAFSP